MQVRSLAQVRGSIGQILLRQGVIDADTLSDALTRQSGRHPVASVLYTLGYASERQLAMALAQQTGWPAIVLDESAIHLDGLGHISLEWARSFQAMIVHEDDKALVIAAARPEDAIAPARELATARGKRAELRICLDVTLARTVRLAFRKFKAGETFLVGPEVDRPGAFLSIVQPDGDEDEHRSAQRALAEDAARSIERDDELPSIERVGLSGSSDDWLGSSTTTATDVNKLEEDDAQDAIEADRTMFLAAEIDRGDEPTESSERQGPQRALVVDPDPSGRIQMVAELEKLGYECQAAASGSQAIELLSQLSFELMFSDVATPDVDGLRLCRAVKRSRRLTRCRVVVTASVVDSGQVPDDVLQRHGADGYLEKPLDSRRLHNLLHDLVPREGDRATDHEALVAEALARYHAGDVDGAIAKLRGSLVSDPTSPKLHFMLANMLQRAARWAESVDEYEAVVELQPAYFPALTRLAYLYYRQGLYARAVETWRRALPVCEDPALRRNIELFMRKLVADMTRQDAAG